MWNNAGTIKITGEIDFKLLERAVNFMLEKCHSLRTHIKMVNETPMQYIPPYVWNPIELIDFTDQKNDALYRWDLEQSALPVDYIDCDLYYFTMLKFSHDQAGLYIRIHHLISDAWSIITLVNGITEAYDYLLRGDELPGKDIPLYWEYLERERGYMESPRFENDRKYWHEKFKILPEHLDLKNRRDGLFQTTAERCSFITPEHKALRIMKYCQDTSVSVFSFIISIFSIYLNRLTGKTAFVIGTSVLNRINEREKETFGMFVSTMPILIKISPEMSFAEIHLAVADEIFSSLRHQKYPFNLLMKELHDQNKNTDALFDMTLSFQNASLVKNASRFSYKTHWHSPLAQINGIDIHFNDREGNDVFTWDYNYLKSLFNHHDITQMHDYIENLMTDALEKPDKKIADMNILSSEQEQKLINHLAGPKKKAPHALTLARLYEYRAKSAPASVALISGESSLTANELDRCANGFAWRLKERGIGKDDVVIVMMRRAPELFVVLLGILKAGAAFLPLDPATPSERVGLILSKCSAVAAVADEGFKDIFDATTQYIATDELSDIPKMPDPPEIDYDPSSLAYVIFTSGTTGAPKGVMIENRSICLFVENFGGIMDLADGTLTLCVASISFDLFIMESFPALIHGGTVILATDDEVKIPSSLVGLIAKHHVNSIMFTPSRVQMLLNQGVGDAFGDIAQIMLGGEALTEALVKKLRMYTGAKIYNFYGPTETTIAVTYKPITGDCKINIGRPLPDVNAYILDPNGALAIPGAVGELVIGGNTLARGYIGNKKETDAAFIPDPFRPGQIMYKTGDLACLSDEGELIYAGRRDNQVKIRGYRIELEEIQSRLLEITGITDCAVIDLENERGEKYLCAYICGDLLPTKFELRTALIPTLPHYMIPSYFVRLPSLPMTINGKLDRNALPTPYKQTDLEVINDEQAAPSTNTEIILADIWEEVLNVRPLSRYDNFFDIGGDSMSIIYVANHVTNYFKSNVSLKEVYENPTLNAYALLIDKTLEKSYTPIKHSSPMKDYPASAGQKRIFLLNDIDNTSIVYNMPGAVKITGKFDIARFKQALNKIINLHATLRTGFYIRNGELRQKTYKNTPIKIGIHKCNQEALNKTLRKFIQPFEIAHPPLIRVEYVKLDETEHVVFIDMHHIISDGISYEMIFKQLSLLYSGAKISPCELHYSDYALWQKEYLLSEAIQNQRDYWLNHLSGELPTLSLRSDHPRKTHQNFKGRRTSIKMPKKFCNEIHKYAKTKGLTTYTVMLGAFYILMARYSGQDDIIIGTPTSGRSRPELLSMIGMFVNTLALRAHPHADKKCTDFLTEIKKIVIDGMINQDYPFELLVNDLKIQRDLSHNPLFDIFFAYNTSKLNLTFEKTTVNEIKIPWNISKFDLTFDIRDTQSEMHCTVEYSEIFSTRTAKQMANRYVNILYSIIADDTKTIGQIDILGFLEKNRLIQHMRGLEIKIDPKLSVEDTICSYGATNGDAKALICGDKSRTFKELYDMSGQLAAILKSRGVKSNTTVVVSMSRSIELVAAIIGILRAGGAYLPIDPEYPKDRIAYMIKDSGATLAISDHPMPKEIDTISPEEAFTKNAQDDPYSGHILNPPDSTAYIIYTSGSTGLPKGVRLTRANLINYCEACRKFEIFKPGEVSMSVTTISFDIFVLECIVSLYFGGAVAVSSEEQQRIPSLLAEFMRRSGCSFIQFTPSRLALMLSDKSFREALGNIKTIVLGGEMLPGELLLNVKKYTRARIINGYGPTETTVYSTFKDLTKSTKVTIGKPVLNTQLYILDSSMNLVPEGVVGELYIGGNGVSPGYLNRDELTKTRFIADPFAESGVIYRSGDLACLLPNGDIACLGRTDDQLKISGQRIEPGEIEKALETYPEINKAVVVIRPVSGNLRLCGYYTSTSKEDISPDTLRLYLKKKLPIYMIPNYFLRIEKFPLTASGKIERKLLPNIDLSKQENKSSTPMTREEIKIAKIWKKVLGIDDIGPEDDFFSLGGDSMAVIKAQIEMLKHGIKIGTQEFYENPTIRSIRMFRDESISVRTALKPENKPDEKKYPTNVPSSVQGPFPMKKILLTGATGYLGAHVLKELVEMDGVEILCLIRGADLEDRRGRLEKILGFYFGETKNILRHVTTICGDISSGEGLLPDLAPDTVTNCAAETRHYGKESIFTLANVTGVKNLVDFCKKCGAALCHISTTSVSGTIIRSPSQSVNNKIFSEKDFYIHQNYSDNLYVKSKFEAEALLYKEMRLGLKAKIMRVGNLMPRYVDGVFQSDPSKNAFMNRLRAYKLMGATPKSIIKNGAEFTPVDSCAKAIVLLTGKDNGSVYHLFNPNHASGRDIIEILNTWGTHVRELEDSTFVKEVKKTMKTTNAHILGGMIEDLVQIPRTGARVSVSCKETAERLSRLSFNWKKPDKTYLKKALTTIHDT